MQYHLGYIAVRILVVAGLMILLNTLYKQLFLPKLLKKEGWLHLLVERRLQKTGDLWYFSASPNAACAPSDSSCMSISDLVELKSGCSIIAIDTGAIHAGIFVEILRRTKQKPKHIIADLNLRSFGQEWIHSDLENHLQRNLAYWSSAPALWTRLSVVLKNYPFVPQSERKKAIEYALQFEPLWNNQVPRKLLDSLYRLPPSEHNEKAKLFTRAFAFKVTQDNSMLQHYKALVSLCKAQDIPLTLTILPEDISWMHEHIGISFIQNLRKNNGYIKRQLLEMNYPKLKIIDLSEKLPSFAFYEFFPTEHYSLEGRTFVAHAIAEHIRQWKYAKHKKR